MDNHYKKLLFVNGHLNAGGVEKSLHDLLIHLDKSKYDIDVLLLEGKGDLYANSIPDNIHIIVFDTRQAFGPLFSTLIRNLFHGNFSLVIFRMIIVLSSLFGKKLYCFIKPLLGIKKHYDIAIAYRMGLPNEIVSLTVKSEKKICWWHHGENFYSDTQINYIKQLWGNMNAIITVSEGCKNMITNKFHINKDLIKVIPNIIDLDAIEQLSGNVNPYEKSDCINIVSLGRLGFEKHMDDIPVLSQKMLDRGFNHFKWHIIGDGEMFEDIKQKIQKFNVEKYVFLMGKKSNPYPFLKYADILVHTSHVEAHCLTILEAMALKTPCVVTQTTIPQDFTENGVNCIIAKQQIESQVSCILTMIEKLSTTSNMTDKAYQLVRDNYNWRKITHQFDILMEAI